MTGVESINDEAVGAAAWVLWSTFDVAVTSDEVRAALAAALPLLRLSDVPGLERQLRDKIAGEIEAAADDTLTGIPEFDTHLRRALRYVANVARGQVSS